MALQKQMKSIPLTSGVDEKASDKHLQPPKLYRCDNGKFSKTGQVQKRNGFTRVANTKITGTITAAEQCANYKDERLIFDGANAYARSSSGTWVDRGRITASTFDDSYIHNNDSVTTTPLQIARANGYRVEAWSETDPEYTGAADIPWQVYGRVIDEATGLEVVPRTRVTPVGGISVTKAMAQYDDSNYFNPQVQCVAIAGFIYILFCDCDATTSLVNITGTSSGGAGFTNIDCASYPDFLHDDIVTIAGTTSHNGNWKVIEPHSEAAGTNRFTIQDPYSGSSETGTVSIKTNYAGINRMGVHASVVNTNTGVAAALTPTSPAMDATSIVFHVNATFPLFVVDHVANATLADGAIVFRLSPAPSVVATNTQPYYRADYFMESSGAIVEFMEGSNPGYRGRNSIILQEPYFQAKDAGHDGKSRTLSHIACKAGLGTEGDEACVAFTHYDYTKSIPEIMTQVYDKDLAAVGSPLEILESYVLLSASFASVQGGDDVTYFVFTGQGYASLASLVSPDPSQANEHFIAKAKINVNTGALDTAAASLRRFTAITTDLFRDQMGNVYFGATYAITPSSALYEGGNVAFANFGSSVNVISDTDGNIVAAGGTGLGGVCPSTDWAPIYVDGRALFWFVARVEAPATNEYLFGSSKYTGVTIGGGAVMQNRSVFNPSIGALDFDPAQPLPNTEAGNSLLLAGGLLWEYGGDWMKENGFLTYPQVRDRTNATTGGALPNGTWSFQVCYEWTNSNGAVQRSYPSDPVQVTLSGVTGSNGKITLTVYTPQWTQKRDTNYLSNPRIVIFRTEEGPGSIWYRVKDVEADMSDSFQDIVCSELADTSIIDNEQIYTTGAAGDIFGNICPPCPTDIVLHKERVFLATIEGSVWYSKKLTPGVAVEFAEQQVKPIDNYSAQISCIGAVRDYVIAITADNAYFIAGDGPNSAGVGSDFSAPTIFSRDSGGAFGCARTTSPIGFLYEAKGGIYQVTPSMQVKWIGAPVEDSVDKVGITRAVVNDNEGEIYFGLNSTTSGILVYNYVFDAWSHWRPRYPAFSSDVTPKGMIVDGGVLNIAIPSGYLLEQNTGFTDIGSATYTFSLSVTTPWLRSDQFLHMVRFYNTLVSGTYKSDHTLNCTIYSNYDESLSDAQSLVVTSSTSSPYILRQHVKNQKARALKITISDTPTSGTFESYQLDGFAVEFGIRAGTFKLGTTKTLA
tara:strand:+ start:727 stop:4329 length:3603 start_codon:yes stop_codon:yes gene_type:complete